MPSDSRPNRALLFFQTRQAPYYTRHNRVTCCPKAASSSSLPPTLLLWARHFAGFVHISEMSKNAMSRLILMCEAGQAVRGEYETPGWLGCM